MTPSTHPLPDTLPALSLHAHWAWAIFLLGKDIENRSRRLRYTGPLIVHASKRCPAAARVEALHWMRTSIGFTRDQLKVLDDQPCGGLVGIVDVAGCAERSNSSWFVGPFGLVLARPRRIAFLPYAGRQGVFYVPREALRPSPPQG